MVRLLRYGTIFGPLKDRWRYLYKEDLYRRRTEAGPEPERFRSSLINWFVWTTSFSSWFVRRIFPRNYDAELYACTHRFGEKIQMDSLRRAMTDASFLNQIVKQRAEAGKSKEETFELSIGIFLAKVWLPVIRPRCPLPTMRNWRNEVRDRWSITSRNDGSV